MSDKLAIHGGNPVRTDSFGPSHDFGDDDAAAVSEVIKSGKLNKGPKIDEFEKRFAEKNNVKYAVTVSSGTAAMHTCVGAVNTDPGSEIITTPWTSAVTLIGTLLHN